MWGRQPENTSRLLINRLVVAEEVLPFFGDCPHFYRNDYLFDLLVGVVKFGNCPDMPREEGGLGNRAVGEAPAPANLRTAEAF